MSARKLTRPLLSMADRNRLAGMAHRAATHAVAEDPSRVYAQAVVDVLRWLADNADPSPMLVEVTR